MCLKKSQECKSSPGLPSVRGICRLKSAPMLFRYSNVLLQDGSLAKAAAPSARCKRTAVPFYMLSVRTDQNQVTMACPPAHASSFAK